jgi:hypothetical protein
MFKLSSRDPLLEDAAIKKQTIISGLLYGVFYAIGFSLVTWGSDGWLLNKFGDAAPWDKLWVGLPILLLIGILAGGIGVLTSSNLISILVWGAVGYGTGFLVGHVPFEGINLITWLREPRLWGEVIYAFEKGAQVRTVLITVITTLLGFFVGGLKNMAVHWAWDQGTQNHRLSWKSVLALWISLPPVILQAVMADQFMNRPLREPQKAIDALMEIALDDETIITDSQKVGLRSLQPYQQEITPIYRSHLVGFSKSTDSWYSGYVDLGLSPSLILRCVTVGDRVVYF